MSSYDVVPDHLKRVLFTQKDMESYYDRIELPKAHRHEPGTFLESARAARSPDEGLIFLTALQRCHLAAIPFENISLHYSPHHTISIDTSALYDKIVASKAGRGGYCMENNSLFGTLLRSLGFDVYPVGARINSTLNGPTPTPVHTGWGHQINIVTIGEDNYMVDVGLGSSGPTKPLILSPASATPTLNSAPQNMRLTKGPIPDNTRKTGPAQQLWNYSVQHDPERNSEWMPCYCFSELVFLPEDFVVMNHYESTARTSWFTYQLVCAKYIMEDGGPVGTVSLNGHVLKRRLHGKSETLVECKTDQERIEVLKEYFGITLSDAERKGIKGMVSALG